MDYGWISLSRSALANDATDGAVCAARRYHDDRRKKHKATHGDDESEEELAVQDDM